MVSTKKGDFIEVEYTGRAGRSVFDTTHASVAKDSGLQHSHFEFKPQVICLGEKHMLPGLEAELAGKEVGKVYTITLPPERAFGKKNPKLLRMVPTSSFSKEKIMPVPGLTVNIDGIGGIIRTVTGGRVIVDFNHPLAGKEVVYDIRINRIVDDEKLKVESLMKALLGIKPKIELNEQKAIVTVPAEIPKEIAEDISKKVAGLTKIKEVGFVVEKEKVQTVKV